MATIENISCLRPVDDPNAVCEISFDDVVPGSVIRQVVINDKQYLAVKDAIKIMCNTNNRRACDIWRTLRPELKEELKEHLNTFNRLSANAELPDVITFQGLMKLVMYLPGLHAQHSRAALAALAHRYIAGDTSLVDEVFKNEQSTSAFALMAKAELDPTRPTYELVRDTFDQDLTRQKFEQEMQMAREKFQQELAGQKLEQELTREKFQQELAGQKLEQELTRQKFEQEMEMAREKFKLEIRAAKADVAIKEGKVASLNAFNARTLYPKSIASILKNRGKIGAGKPIKDFLSAFLQEVPDDSKHSAVPANKLFGAYQAYATLSAVPIISITRFGRDLVTVDGVSKRRATAGWVYSLDHAHIKTWLADQQ